MTSISNAFWVRSVNEMIAKSVDGGQTWQLIVLNMYHGSEFCLVRRWDYFVKYLLGVTVPARFEIHDNSIPTPGRP